MRSILYYLIELKQHHLRQNIKIGSTVLVVQKKDQRTNILTKGKVKQILTNKSTHTRGIKVKLHNNKVGRVQQILKEDPNIDIDNIDYAAWDTYDDNRVQNNADAYDNTQGPIDQVQVNKSFVAETPDDRGAFNSEQHLNDKKIRNIIKLLKGLS